MNVWYEHSFGQDYLIVYKHRDMQGAYREVRQMMDWLNLPPGSEVLDLCCGMGRHSLALTDFGYKVTGVDLSEVLLAEAKRQDVQGKVAWLRGDMRKVPAAKRFDAVVNLFTSFGYFEKDGENAGVIREMNRLLKSGGSFIIDFLNPQYVKDHLVPYSERMEGAARIEERRGIEDGFVRKRIVISEDGAPSRQYLEQVKLYDLNSFKSMLNATSLRLDLVYGGYAGEAYDPKSSERMIMIGHKAAAEKTANRPDCSDLEGTRK